MKNPNFSGAKQVHRGWVLVALNTVIIASLSMGSPSLAIDPFHTPSTERSKELWISVYDFGWEWDGATAIVASPDGSKVFVTGQSSGNSRGFDYATVAYNALTGAELWAARYDFAWEWDEPTAIAASPDGSKVFVTGQSYGASGSDDYATIAYSAETGAELWVSRYDFAGYWDSATAIVASPDGSKVFVTGQSYGVSGYDYDYATVAYGAETGAVLWASRYGFAAGGQDSASAMTASPDGSKVFVTGWSQGVPGYDYDYATVAYSAGTGAELWAARYDFAADGQDGASAIAASLDGSTVFVTGWSHGVSGHTDYATVAYSAGTGAELWASRYDFAGHSDQVSSIALSPDGSRVFVTGSSHGNPSADPDYATVAYSAENGGELWAARYDFAADKDHASSIALSPDGSKVFVTGASGTHSATVAYRAGTGRELWVSRTKATLFSHAVGADSARAIAVSPDGSKVFVTGWSYYGPGRTAIGVVGRGYDYATIAYGTDPPSTTPSD